MPWPSLTGRLTTGGREPMTDHNVNFAACEQDVPTGSHAKRRRLVARRHPLAGPRSGRRGRPANQPGARREALVSAYRRVEQPAACRGRARGTVRASRLGYTEAIDRASIYIAALSGAVVS